MPRSTSRHVVAILRHFLHMTQRRLAELVGVSEDLIRSVELGRTPLSLSLAKKLASATGVDVEWLIRNDLNSPPCSTFTQNYTLDFFKSWQAQRSVPLPAELKGGLPIYLLARYVALRGISEAAAAKSENNVQLFLHELEEFVANARVKYGSSVDFNKRIGPQELTSNQLLIAEKDVRSARKHLEADSKIFGVVKAPPPPPSEED